MPESIGGRLKQAREARRLTLEKAAEATRVRLHYLQALENDDYSVMVSAAQGRGFLRLYADFLGLDLDQIVSDVKAAGAMSQPRLPSAPAADATPEPTPPASASDDKPARPGFWSRLLRKPASAEAVTQASDLRAEPAAPASAVEEAVAEEPAKRTRRAASATEPEKEPARVAAGKKKRS
ncbi:MAG: helix-turn-helix domain-containing protein, partial [Chloroflexota bacterium]